jgi:hypothetical protein
MAMKMEIRVLWEQMLPDLAPSDLWGSILKVPTLLTIISHLVWQVDCQIIKET